MKRYLPLIIVSGVALATLGSGAMLYWAKRPHPLVVPEGKIAGAKGDVASMHTRGHPDAPVTLEEFGDFQCAPCRFIAGLVDQLVEDYQPRLRVVFRNFPLSSHQHARAAALAAEAAGLQGRFWEMHDVLYREQGVWSKADDADESFKAYAGKLGLNLAQFEKDVAGEKPRARVATDQERGKSLGVKVTPTFFVNNREVSGDNKTPNGLRAMIDAALKAKPATESK